MAPARSGLLAVRTDDVEDEPRSHFRHGLLARDTCQWFGSAPRRLKSQRLVIDAIALCWLPLRFVARMDSFSKRRSRAGNGELRVAGSGYFHSIRSDGIML